MNSFIIGFADELTKTSGALKALGTVGKTIVKHPAIAITGGLTGAATIAAARSGYKKGRSGDQSPRYLLASYNPITGRAQASDAAHINYNRLFSHKPTKRETKRTSGNYKEKNFKRV